MEAGTYEFSGIQTAVKLNDISDYVPDDDVNQGGIKFTFVKGGGPAKFGITIPGISDDARANFLADERLGANTMQSGQRAWGDIDRWDSRSGSFAWQQYISMTPDPEAPLQSSDLAYTYLGNWAQSNSTYIIDRRGFFVAGFQTPVGQVPTSGSARFGGVGTVQGQMFAGPVASRSLLGDSELIADFGAGKVTGTFKNMMVSGNSALEPWNTINIAASISGNGFAGTTSSQAHPGTFSLGESSGNIKGGFYGPNAREVGAVWTLSDGTNSAAGVLGAKRMVP